MTTRPRHTPGLSVAKPAEPIAIDLFAGCGGLTVGLKRAGFRVVGAVEIDPLAAATYRENHPHVRVLERDIRGLTGPAILRALALAPGELDLMAGCPPCQGFSTVRTLNGKRRAVGSSNRLLFEFLRLARSLRPRCILLENVPALRDNWRFSRLTQALQKLGYQCASAVVDAAHHGVPQRRRRMVLLASRVGTPVIARSGRVRRTVRDAIGHLPHPGATRDPAHDLPERRSEQVQRLIREIPQDGGSRRALGAERQLACHRKLDGFFDVYGRMSWDDVSPTITGGCVNPSKGRFLHPIQHRTITLREAALLQGFPPRYRFDLSRGKFAAAQMVGNAFPPPLAAAQARELRMLILAADLLAPPNRRTTAAAATSGRCSRRQLA